MADNKQASMTTVVAASAAGTAFEWYDFFLFVPLATVMSKTFFSGLPDDTAFIFALGSFAIGFAFRPVGALIFGRIGDRIGRKATFLVTMGLMGVATFAIGFLPTYADVGIAAPLMFIGLRVLQGLAIGGEWGGAAIYIVEHVAPNRRGLTSSWLGGSAAFGLFGALLAVYLVRKFTGPNGLEVFPVFDYFGIQLLGGWRIPFFLSAVLLGISIWIRLKLHESPVFAKMRDEGTRSERPYVESFLQWANLKTVLITLFGIMIAQGAVWYTVFFYAQSFLEKSIKVDPAQTNAIMLILTMVSVPMYLFFGWLSDRVGRKPVMLGGLILMLIAYFPAFHALETFGNPALSAAQARAPVVVVADPANCSFQFDPVGKVQFRTSCDIAKSTLAAAGVSYANEAGHAGSLASIRVGAATAAAPDGTQASKEILESMKKEFTTRVGAVLKEAGYPPKADPETTNTTAIFLILLLMTVGATALYGPQAACLVELFPAKVRYTALSLPYHIGTGWVGGFLPAMAFAIVAATGNIFAGLWYPFAFTAIAAVVMFFFLKDPRGRALD